MNNLNFLIRISYLRACEKYLPTAAGAAEGVVVLRTIDIQARVDYIPFIDVFVLPWFEWYGFPF